MRKLACAFAARLYRETKAAASCRTPRNYAQDGHYTVPERPPQYVYKAGYFEPTPEFDRLLTKEEAVQKRIISRNGPWAHLDEEGKLVNRADPR